ncbi:cGMP-specific 3',5'-cyclic phosphodiesterase-like [Aedes albopictus]|uniref:Uncharacterized protein n=1 Tax=Aedes albopictus TaxID=7160 RepID=A0ABM1ZNP9_AEDAL
MSAEDPTEVNHVERSVAVASGGGSNGVDVVVSDNHCHSSKNGGGDDDGDAAAGKSATTPSSPPPQPATTSSSPSMAARQESPLNNNNNNRTNGADIIGDNCCAGIPKLSSQCENGEASEVNYGLIGANSRPSTGGGSVSVCSGTAVTAEDPNLLSPNNSQRSSMSQSQSPTHHLQPPGCSPEELDEVGTFFDEHAAAIERWFRERAPPEVIAKLQSITGGGDVCKSTPRSPHRASVTSDLFQQWLASSPVKVSPVTTATAKMNYISC